MWVQRVLQPNTSKIAQVINLKYYFTEKYKWSVFSIKVSGEVVLYRVASCISIFHELLSLRVKSSRWFLVPSVINY